VRPFPKAACPLVCISINLQPVYVCVHVCVFVCVRIKNKIFAFINNFPMCIKNGVYIAQLRNVRWCVVHALTCPKVFSLAIVFKITCGYYSS